jgi:N-acetylglucosamine kinase-like BadF-type ATPase
MAVAPGPRAEHPLCHPWHPARCNRTTLARVTGGDDNVRLSAMLRRHLRSPGLIVGVDAGGTWVRVRAIAEGRGPFSLKRPVSAVPELATFLHSLWRRRGWTRGGVEALVVAARGVWLPRERRALRRRVAGLARRVDVIADVEAAWHATLGAERGVLVLAGTGSIALGRDARGRWARAGGLGPLLGDEGSAFWIGREWLRATASEATRRRFATSPHAVRAVAALAPRVVARARRGQRGAARIVTAAQAHLASQAADVARVLRLPSPVVMGGAGSVMEDRWFAAGVRQALARAGVRAHWRESGGEPVDAAVRLAASLAARRR